MMGKDNSTIKSLQDENSNLRRVLDGKSHRATVPSEAPEIRQEESGEKAHTLTGLLPGCWSTASISPLAIAHTTVVASVEQDARYWPQGLKQQQWTP